MEEVEEEAYDIFLEEFKKFDV
jgi:hypothetical protein